jgi:hypothetical protein
MAISDGKVKAVMPTVSPGCLPIGGKYPKTCVFVTAVTTPNVFDRIIYSWVHTPKILKTAKEKAGGIGLRGKDLIAAGLPHAKRRGATVKPAR